MGKGSVPRPYSVPKETFDKAFDRIFGKKDEDRKNDTRKYRNDQSGIYGGQEDSSDVRNKAQ